MRDLNGHFDLALSRPLAGLAGRIIAAIGLYGVMSYVVSRRTQEIGIRLALGAQRRSIFAMVLGDVSLLVGIGVAIGVPSAAAVGRLMQSQLFELSATDPFSPLARASCSPRWRSSPAICPRVGQPIST